MTRGGLAGIALLGGLMAGCLGGGAVPAGGPEPPNPESGIEAPSRGEPLREADGDTPIDVVPLRGVRAAWFPRLGPPRVRRDGGLAWVSEPAAVEADAAHVLKALVRADSLARSM